MIEFLFSILGIALCAMVLLQLAQWSAGGLIQLRHNRRQFEVARESLRRHLDERFASIKKQEAVTSEGNWQGFREFVVLKTVKETNSCTSVYLEPADGKPVVSFKAGQHLTLEFAIPGEPKPVVRCYSLSSAAGESYYRISVKAIGPPPNRPELAPGKVSNFINNVLSRGDRVRAKSPAGSFFLDETSQAPLVLLAGGVGITPMLCMIERELQRGSERLVLLMYGVRNSSDHPFKEHLAKLADQHANLHVVNVYSQPLATDRQGVDFHMAGFVTVDLLNQLLPHNQCQFYLCGPPPFMASLYPALLDWQVPESRVFFEAFGPATIKRKSAEQTLTSSETNVPVQLSLSGKELKWTGEHESLLDFAESHGIEIDSGCRAGNCGTCETKLKGKVVYLDGAPADCSPGACLVCVARPDGPIELEA